MKTPVTRRRLRHHLRYSWWKYLLLAVGCLLGWNLIFAVTEPRPPREQSLELVVYADGDTYTLQPMLEQLRLERLPEQQLITAAQILPDSNYGAMALHVRVMSGEGDLFVMSQEDFHSCAAQGMFAPLEEDTALVSALEAAGVNLERGWRRVTDSGERHLLGVPASTCPWLAAMLRDGDSCWLSVRDAGPNLSGALALLRMLTEPTDVNAE